MDAATLATVQQGGNFLGVFLCTGALATLRRRASAPELNALLVRGLATYAPAFRGALAEAGREVEPALERLDALTQLGVNFDAPGEVTDLRAALRELLANVGFTLPAPVRGASVACELHGDGCPELRGAEPAAARRRGAATARRKRRGKPAAAGKKRRGK
jgi:hypothetical protein